SAAIVPAVGLAIAHGGYVMIVGFAYRDVMEYRQPLDHSGLMPANLTTLPHFAVSSAINMANSAGELTRGVAPNSAYRSLKLGSTRTALISLFSLSMISTGVP